MRAVQLTSYGPAKDLAVSAHASDPEAKPGHVLVEVTAAGLNPIDWKIATGELKRFMPLPFPFTLASDFSGIVVKVGAGVSNLHVGDEVYGMAGFNRGGSGSLADFALANAAFVWQKPPKLTFEEAAAVPMAGLRAWSALNEVLQLQKGQKFFMPGGAGGIGSFAIQIAKHLGAYVSTSVRTKDVDFVKGLGADEVFDYTKEDFSTQLSGYDAVFDVVGGETFAKCFAILRPGGKITTMLWERRPDLVQKHQATFVEQRESATPTSFKELSELLDIGAVGVHIDKTFPFEQTGQALEYLESGHPQGKVIVSVAPKDN